MKRWLIYFFVLSALLVGVALIAIGMGVVSLPATDIARLLLFGPEHSSLTSTHIAVIQNIRLPRVILAMLVGANLAMSGVLMQALFRNPLADPGLIGISAGAALGAVTVIVLGSYLQLSHNSLLAVWLLPIAAFVGATVSAFGIYQVAAARTGEVDVVTLLLCGIAFNALAGAIIGLLTYIANDTQLRSLSFWNLGSLGGASWQAVVVLACVCGVLVGLIAPRTQHINALLLGEAEAKDLGVSTRKLKNLMLCGTTACAGVAVAFTGIIGFIGLVAPHIARLLCGADHRVLLPMSALIGALLVTLGDLAARTLARPEELPLGVLTALIGAPFFLLLIKQRRG